MSLTRKTTTRVANCRAAHQAGELPRQKSTDLLQGGRRLIIEHEGEAYCLRVTRNERLILTKL